MNEVLTLQEELKEAEKTAKSKTLWRNNALGRL